MWEAILGTVVALVFAWAVWDFLRDEHKDDPRA